MFRVGYSLVNEAAKIDPLKFLSQLKSNHAYTLKTDGIVNVVSSTDQAAKFNSAHPVEDFPIHLSPAELVLKGFSFYGDYKHLVDSLNLVKHVYYLPKKYGRIPAFFNLAADHRFHHYFMNPTTTSLMSIVEEELKKLSVIAPPEIKTHEEYIKYLESLKPSDVTPWRKVPMYGTPEAANDKGFVEEYGPIMPPTQSNEIRDAFQVLFHSIARGGQYEPFLRMYLTQVELKIVDFDKAESDEAKDNIGEEILSLYDKVGRFGAAQLHRQVRKYTLPRHHLLPHTSVWQVPSHPFSTAKERTIAALPRFAIDDMRKWFLERARIHAEPDFDEDTCPYPVDDIIWYRDTVRQIDLCGAFGKTPCPYDFGEWPWNKK